MLKITVIAVICAFILIYLKNINSEFFSVALLGASVIIIASGMDFISEAAGMVARITDITGIDPFIYSVIAKIVGIAYVVQFGSGMIEDLGLKSLSDKLVFIGKLAVLTVSIPLITGVINILTGLLK